MPLLRFQPHLAAALLLAAAGGILRAQQPADSAAVLSPDSARARAARAAAAADTLRSRGAPAARAIPDSLATLPDSTRQKILARTPLFPEDVDPYTPLGAGRPARVIERSELAGWPAFTLAEILPRLYPLALDEQGGPGFFADLRLSSGLPGATRIYLDGRPLETPLGPAADLRTIPVSAIERIEIFSGPGAVPGAEAGWIDVVTRTHLTPQASSGLSFELGDLGREAFAGGFGRWLGSRLSGFLALKFDDANTITGIADAKTSLFWGRARLYLARRQFVEASYGTSEATTDSQRSTPTELSPFTGREDRRERRFLAYYRGALGPALASVSFYTDRFEELESFAEGESDLVSGKADREGARASVRLSTARGPVEAGVEWGRERLDSASGVFLVAPDEPVPDSTGFDDSRTRTAGYLAAEGSLDSLFLSARISLERLDSAGETASEPALAAEARYAAPAGVTPFLRVGRGPRFPSFVEAAALARAGGRDAVTFATSREVRLGAAWRRGRRSGELAAFSRWGSDVSLWLPPTGWRSALGNESVRLSRPAEGDSAFAEVNLLDLRTRGIDLRLQTPLPFGLRGDGAALLQSVEDAEGNRLPYLARAQALGRVTYARGFFPSRNLTLEASVEGRVIDSRMTLAGRTLPASSQMDLLVRARLIGFTAGLSVFNVFDQRVRTEEDFPLPGRIVGFGIFWEFWD